MAGQELADVFQFPHARDRVADATRLEVGQGKRQHMTEQLRAESDVDPVCRMREEICPQTAEHRIEHGQRDHADGEHVQGREALMYQDLVDDYLRKERCQQGKQLENERGRKHLAKKSSIFDDGRNEPGKVKLQILLPQVRSLRKEK